MAKKVLSAVLTMKDQNFSANMKRASKGVNGFDKRIKYAGNQVKKFKDSTASSFSSIAKGAAGLAAAYVGLSALNNFKNETVELAKAQIDAETKLASVMKNTKGVTDQHIQSVKSYASEVQNLGVIGDEVQLAGVQQLATFQLQGKTLKKLMPGMADLIAQQKGLGATQQDAVTIGNMFGKVMNGQVGALSRAGINFTKAQETVLKFGTESQKAATLAEVLEMNVGGVNAAMAKTDQGKIQQMQNAWGDYKEEIGKKILPLQAQFAGWFFKQIPKIQDLVLGSLDKGVVAFNKIKDFGVKAFNKIKEVVKNNQPVIEGIKSRIESLGEMAIQIKDWTVDAFQNIKAKVQENRPVIDGVKAVLEDLGNKATSLKEWLVSAFESAQPGLSWLKDEGLPLVVDGIAGVIEKATDVYNFINDNWNSISPIVYGIAGALLVYKGYMLAASFATGAVTLATNVWAGVTKGAAIVQGAFNAVLRMSPLGWVATAIGVAIAAGVLLYKNWDKIKEAAGLLWSWLKEKFGGIRDAVKEKLQPVMDFFTNLKNLWDKFKKSIANFKMPKIGLPKWLGGKGLIQGSFAVGTNRVPRDMVAQIHKDEMIVPAKQSKQLRSMGVGIKSIDSLFQNPNRGSNKNHTSSNLVNISNVKEPSVKSNSESNDLIQTLIKAIKEMRKGDVYIDINGVDKSTDEILNDLIPRLKLTLANM